MPAERTKKESPLISPLSWAETETPETKSAAFAFAPNVTPNTFTDPSSEAGPSFTAPQESFLFPPAEGEDAAFGGAAPTTPTKRRAGHSRRKGADHIPRPPNAFILFRSSFIKSQAVTAAVETNHSTLSKIIGLTWQNLPPEERNIWHQKAKAALEEHKRRWPTYAFKPAASTGKAARSGSGSAADGKPAKTEKRKLKEIAPKDMVRCAKIAELLCEGKKGAELDAAIEEFDRTHVAPAIEHRFEAPLTVRTYRRSSSAPAIAEAGEHVRFLAQIADARPASPKPKRSASAGPTDPSLTISTSMAPPPPPVALEFNMDMFAQGASSLNFEPPSPAFTFDQFSVPPSATSELSPLATSSLDPASVASALSPTADSVSDMPPLVERPFDPFTDLPEGFLPPSSPTYPTPMFTPGAGGATFDASFGTPYSVPESAYEFPAYAPAHLAQHGPHVIPRLSVNTIALLEQIAAEPMPGSACASAPPSAASVDGAWPWPSTPAEPVFLQPTSPGAYAPSPVDILSAAYAAAAPAAVAKAEPFSPTLQTSFSIPPAKAPPAEAFRVNFSFAPTSLASKAAAADAANPTLDLVSQYAF